MAQGQKGNCSFGLRLLELRVCFKVVHARVRVQITDVCRMFACGRTNTHACAWVWRMCTVSKLEALPRAREGLSHENTRNTPEIPGDLQKHQESPRMLCDTVRLHTTRFQEVDFLQNLGWTQLKCTSKSLQQESRILNLDAILLLRCGFPRVHPMCAYMRVQT